MNSFLSSLNNWIHNSFVMQIQKDKVSVSASVSVSLSATTSVLQRITILKVIQTVITNGYATWFSVSKVIRMSKRKNSEVYVASAEINVLTDTCIRIYMSMYVLGHTWLHMIYDADRRTRRTTRYFGQKRFTTPSLAAHTETHWHTKHTHALAAGWVCKNL